jgi:hypothetical protein
MNKNETQVNFGTGLGAVTTIVCTVPAIPDENGYVKPALSSLIKTGFSLTHNVLYQEGRAATLTRKY